MEQNIILKEAVREAQGNKINKITNEKQRPMHKKGMFSKQWFTIVGYYDEEGTQIFLSKEDLLMEKIRKKTLMN